MRRALLLAAGFVLAWYALRFGHGTPVTMPKDAWTFSELWQDIYRGRSWAMYGVAVIASIATIVAGFAIFFGKLARQGVYTGATGVAWTMMVLALSAFAFGAFAQPFNFDANPLQWWSVLDSEWLAAGIAALVPTAFLLLSLASEVLARLFGRYTENAPQPVVKVTTDFGVFPGQIKALFDDLQERKKAPAIKWSEILNALEQGVSRLELSLAEHRGADLTALKTTMGEIAQAVKQRNAEASPNAESDAVDRLATILEFLDKNDNVDVELVGNVRDLLQAVERKPTPFLPPAMVSEAVRAAAE